MFSGLGVFSGTKMVPELEAVAIPQWWCWWCCVCEMNSACFLGQDAGS